MLWKEAHSQEKKSSDCKSDSHSSHQLKRVLKNSLHPWQTPSNILIKSYRRTGSQPWVSPNFYFCWRAKSFSQASAFKHPRSIFITVDVAAFPSMQVTFLARPRKPAPWKMLANLLVPRCLRNREDTSVYQFVSPHRLHLLTPGPRSSSFHV